MDKTNQSRYKEIRSKMKKLSVAEKRQIKEEKQQQQQKEKREKQKNKISQRVKININIPSQKTSTPAMNLNSNKEQINLLTSINEQLKKKSQPEINEMFKIPSKESSTIETQTPIENFNIPKPKSKESSTIETQTPIENFNIPKPKVKFDLTPKEIITQRDSAPIAEVESKTPKIIQPPPEGFLGDILSKIKERQDRKDIGEEFKTPILEIPKKEKTLSIADQAKQKVKERQEKGINLEKIEEFTEKNKAPPKIETYPLKEELLKNVSQKNEKKEREMMGKEDIPIVNKPKDKSNLSLIEQVKPREEITKETFEKELDEVTREFEDLSRPKQEDYIEIDKAQQVIEDELQGFSPKIDTNPLTPPKDTTSESIQEQIEKRRGRPKLTEEEKKRNKEIRDQSKKQKQEETEREIREQYFPKKI